MKNKKWDRFNMTTGKFEVSEDNADVIFNELSDALSEEARELLEVYKAEREIVSSILQKALSEEEVEDRSTD